MLIPDFKSVQGSIIYERAQVSCVLRDTCFLILLVEYPIQSSLELLSLHLTDLVSDVVRVMWMIYLRYFFLFFRFFLRDFFLIKFQCHIFRSILPQRERKRATLCQTIDFSLNFNPIGAC